MKDYPKYYLYPSSMFVSTAPHEIITVLGTCIAVCLYDPVLHIGGINHFMLPLWNGEGLPSPKYGNIAIERLIERMTRLGSRKQNLIAKVFGGWDKETKERSSSFDIGHRNTRLAFDLLKKEGIPIVGFSTGGRLGRKILFFSDTGEVHLQWLKKTN